MSIQIISLLFFATPGIYNLKLAPNHYRPLRLDRDLNETPTGREIRVKPLDHKVLILQEF